MSSDEYITDLKRRSAELELEYWEKKVECINMELDAAKQKAEGRR